MRRLFSFRSSATFGSANNDHHTPKDVEKASWETLPREDRNNRGKNDWEAHENCSLALSNPIKKREVNGIGLRRSLSFSGDRCSRYMARLDKYPAYESTSPCRHRTKGLVCSKSRTPNRPSMSKHCPHLDAVQRTPAIDAGISSSSSKSYHRSSGNSPYSSPIPLRCRVARVKKISNKREVQDLCMDGEKDECRLSLNITPDSERCLVENKTVANSGRPPRAYSTAPSTPVGNKENLVSHTLKGMSDFDYLSTEDGGKHDIQQEKFIQRLANSYSCKSRLNFWENDSDTTTTVEDIYEDTSYAHAHLACNDNAKNFHVSDNLCHCRTVRGYHMQDLPCSQKDGSFNKDIWSLKKEENVDHELHMKLKEAKQTLMMLSNTDFGFNEPQIGNLCVSSCLQLIKDINRDRKKLATELVTQLDCRLAERATANDALRIAETELSTRTLRLEKEKQELQSCLEKELDRRSSDWSLKLEKFRSEEHRLRERVRELAEQNISLQREVSSLSGREVDTQDRIDNLESQLIEFTAQLEAVKKENQDLRQALLELKKRCDLAEADRDCIKRSYNVKEKENRELHQIIAKFQRTCHENEKTISGLRQQLEVTANQSHDRDDISYTLQSEQLRLTGVEQTLRKELESNINQVKLLRQENTSLLDRLRNISDGSGSYTFRLDDELKYRVEYLQNQGLSMLYDNSDLCGQLLNLIESQQFKQGNENIEYDAYSLVGYNMKFHGFKREIENLKRSLQGISLVLKEKIQGFSGLQSQASDVILSKEKEDHEPKSCIELELKAETLLTKMLREKLLSKETELEQIQNDLAFSIREAEVLRSEIHGLHSELSSLTHKAKELEHQIVKKDENFNQLEQDLKECLKELNFNRILLPKVSNERDCLWEEVKHLKETDMLFKHEVKSLKKKIDILEEDILVRDGQISILKDDIDSKVRSI